MLAPALPPAAVVYDYALTGADVYRVSTTPTLSRIVYAGNERLLIRRSAGATRFDARARYVRTALGLRTAGTAGFAADASADGSLVDRADDDPDFLTILNQPFAAQLDAATLRDLRALRSAVPFSAASPFGGGAVLRGYLRRGVDGPVGGRPTVAVRFEADGPMSGVLPGRPGASLSGSMRMDGTAYYSLRDAVLLELQTTLTIRAKLQAQNPSSFLPVRITYRRSLRAIP